MRTNLPFILHRQALNLAESGTDIVLTWNVWPAGTPFDSTTRSYSFDSTKLSVYISQFRQEDVRYGTVMGNEHRDILDGHFSGKANGFDWDLEAMGQTGDIRDK